MAIKKVLQIGDQRLKSPNIELSPTDKVLVRKIIKDLTDTMRDEDIVGIAAPQIGINYQIIISEPRQTEHRTADQSDILRVYINPKIIKFSKEETIIYEGCGSVGKDFFGPVKRPKEIIIEAYDINFDKFQLRCDGLLARVIQHEYDHLSGIEFIEKISNYKKVMNSEFYKKLIRSSSEQTKACTISAIDVKHCKNTVA